MPPDNTQPEENSLERALAELAALVQPTAANADINFFNFVPYLLLLWATFRIYRIMPYQSEEEGGTQSSEVKIITLANGRKIFDYGSYLATSTMEDYGSYCTGKLLTTVEEMVKIMAARGVELVGVVGHVIANRAAWMHCLERGIEVSNFYPSTADWDLHQRIVQLREQAGKKTKELISERRPV